MGAWRASSPAPDVRVHAALVDELYARSRVALATFAAALPVVWLLLGRAVHEPGPGAVFAFLVAWTLLRLWTLWWRPAGRWATPRARELVFAGGAIVTGVSLGALNVLAYDQLSPGRVDLLVVFYAGVMSGGLMNLGLRPWLYVAHFVPVMGSMAVLLAMDDRGGEFRLLFLMIVVYLPGLGLMAFQQCRSRTEAIVLGLQLEELALRDVLTGLANRRYVALFMEKEIPRTSRSWSEHRRTGASPQSLGLMLIDIDHFKAVNDRYGHVAGDAVLRDLARVVRESVRDSDVVARWGGEEFLVIARDADRALAATVAERIRARVRATAVPLPDGQTVTCTCSVGLALHPFSTLDPESVDWELVVGIADAGLLHAKQSGRDRVVRIMPGSVELTPEVARSVTTGLDAAVRSGMLEVIVGERAEDRSP